VLCADRFWTYLPLLVDKKKSDRNNGEQSGGKSARKAEWLLPSERGACHFRKYARPPSTHAEQVIYFKTAVKTCYARVAAAPSPQVWKKWRKIALVAG
jgi:hypothetical protein